MKLVEESGYEKVLTETGQLGPYPMERLKHVSQPTTKITNNIQRFDSRQQGFNKAFRGDYGPVVKREYSGKLLRKEPITASLNEMTMKFIDIVDGDVASSKAPLSQNTAILSRHIKSLGYFYRADIVGICELPQWVVYSHDEHGNPIELNHRFAIILVIDQDYKTINASTGYDTISNSQAFLSYVHSAFISCMIADYIRKLGFSARAHHVWNELVVIPPLLLLSGIGELSRPGIILNPFLGLRFKVAVVTTDLLLLADQPINFGLQEFCQRCNRCAVECPAKSISRGSKAIHNGYEVWAHDYEACTKFRILNKEGAGCGRCIKVCPWNKPKGWLHNRARWMVQHAPWLDKSLIIMDDIVGYTKQHKENKWWFDL